MTNNNEELEKSVGIKFEEVTPKDLLKLGKYILFTIALFFVIGGATSIIWPASSVFEACKTILPPIATLIIGYYFGKSQ